MFPFFKYLIDIPPGVDSTRLQAALEHCMGSSRVHVLSRDPLAITTRWGKQAFKITVEGSHIRISPWMPTWAHVLIWVSIALCLVFSAGGILCILPFWVIIYWLVLTKSVGPRIERALEDYFQQHP
jgi:hypothetical protein